jgi:hypothetical protein
VSLHYPAPFSCLKATGFRARAVCSNGVDALLPRANTLRLGKTVRR